MLNFHHVFEHIFPIDWPNCRIIHDLYVVFLEFFVFETTCNNVQFVFRYLRSKNSLKNKKFENLKFLFSRMRVERNLRHVESPPLNFVSVWILRNCVSNVYAA